MDSSSLYQLDLLNGFTSSAEMGHGTMVIEFGGPCRFHKMAPRNGFHWHSGYELCLVFSGEGEYRHGGETYMLSPGDVFVANPGVLHEIRLPACLPEGEMQLVYFLLDLNEDGSTVYSAPDVMRGFTKGHRILSKNRADLFAYLDFLVQYGAHHPYDLHRFGVAHAMSGLVLECLEALLDTTGSAEENLSVEGFPMHTVVPKGKPAWSEPVAEALQLMNANPSANLTLPILARQVHTSPRTLQRMFREQCGASFCSLLRDCRMRQAASLLRMNFRVSEAGARIGLPDPAHFSRTFRGYYGMSPKQYQLTHLSTPHTEHMDGER